jgi:hypothetical protein
MLLIIGLILMILEVWMIIESYKAVSYYRSNKQAGKDVA